MAARIAHNMTDGVNPEAAIQTVSKHGPSASRSSSRDDLNNLDSHVTSVDPAVMCETVRSLASHAHSVMRRTSEANAIGPPPEVAELLVRIDQLQLQIESVRQHRTCTLLGLQSWLDSLRQRVQAALAQSRGEAQE
jgi:hypothetical protein